MAQYVPNETLPIYPTYSTVVKNGVKYKAYFETDWHQVITEDGVPLCELIRSLPSYNLDGYFRYCGILRNLPDKTAIDQLYALTSQKVGDVYLVETDILSKVGYVLESYVWYGNEAGWVYSGTTSRKESENIDLPDIIKLFPDELGEPGQVLVVTEDGKGITWGNIGSPGGGADFAAHNNDPNAHKLIQDKIELKADKLIIFNDYLDTTGWTYDSEFNVFKYVYTNEKIGIGKYFELSPACTTVEENRAVAYANIHPTFEIVNPSDSSSYAILKASRVPTEPIPICIKVFGSYIEN